VKGQPWEVCASWLRPEHVQQLGLPPEAVIAVILKLDGPWDDSNVHGNAPFPDFVQTCMHAIIERSIVLPAVAQRLKNGVMTLPDGRAWELWSQYPGHVRIPSWMTIGHVHVRDGLIVADSYIRNSSYRGFMSGQGQMGVSVMPEEFYPVLIEMLRRKMKEG